MGLVNWIQAAELVVSLAHRAADFPHNHHVFKDKNVRVIGTCQKYNVGKS